MNRVRILYKNLHIILGKEIVKLKEFMEELKTYYNQQDTKLNEVIEKTTKVLQGYQLVECEVSSVQKKVISIGGQITSSVLKKIFKIKSPNSQIIYIMKIIYDILKINIEINEDNSISEKINQYEEINWEFLKEKIQNKSIILLLSYISETSNLNISNEIMNSSNSILTKYDQYKSTYINTFPEIIIIIDFIEVLMVYYKKMNMLKKLYVSNQNKSNKMKTIQSDMDKHAGLISQTKVLLDKVIKDYENYILILKKKDKSNAMIYGYNIIEKYGLLEKYVLFEEHINNTDYNSEFYSNYGGNGYDNLKSKIRYVIKLKKEYRKKERFIEQLSSSLLNYTKGIRNINLEKFIKAITENKNTSVSKKSSNTNRLGKSRNRNNISINISNNNILMRSMESNNSSVNLKGSFQTNPPGFKLPQINNSPFRSEAGKNTTNTVLKKSFVDSYPAFDRLYQRPSYSNKLFKEGLNVSSNEGSQTQTKNTVKAIINSHELNSEKSNKKRKNRNAINVKKTYNKEINLKLENEQFSICSFCCKNLENKIGDICQNK